MQEGGSHSMQKEVPCHLKSSRRPFSMHTFYHQPIVSPAAEAKRILSVKEAMRAGKVSGCTCLVDAGESTLPKALQDLELLNCHASH